MGAFESFKTFMNKPSKDHLAEANGQENIDELAYRRAHREKEAALVHATGLGATAIEQSQLRAEVQAGNEQFGTDVAEKKLDLSPQGDQFHIPDVEPTVTRVEDKVEETAEVKDHEDIAA